MNDLLTPITAAEDKNGWLRLLIPFFIILLTFAVFLPALHNGFVGWDDPETLLLNQKYRGLGLQQLKWMFTTFHMGPYQPLSWATYGMDYLLWGMNPFGYHLTNVVLHSVNAVVFYFLCLELLSLSIRPGTPAEEREIYIPAGFAALFFALHPLRVESVAWVTERRDVLSGLFCLLAALWYIQPRSASGAKVPFWRRHLLPLAAFLLSLLSKGSAVSLPLALIVLDIYPLKRLPLSPRRWAAPEFRGIWLEKIFFFALAAAFGAIGYAGQAKGSVIISYQENGLAARAAMMLFAAAFYVRKTLVPVGLAALYQLPRDFGLMNSQSFLAAAMLTAVTVAAAALRRKWPAVLAAWACYLVLLAPVSGIVRFGSQAAADRYTYLPCLGFAVLAGSGLLACRRAAYKPLKGVCLILACLIIPALARLTWRQERVWQNSETLWRNALAVNPENNIAHNNLAGYLVSQGKFDEAAAHYTEALRLTPDFAEAHNNLAGILAMHGNFDEALRHCLEAARYEPSFSQAHFNAGIALTRLGRPEQAALQYREALRINPDYDQARYNLNSLLSKRGKPGPGVKH